ncbi:MAG: CDP-alcohol phosphatidyltransferase family protein [bacterium]|nr:CDP-alcohol phosphatidyltransferase family protein [bacterium]
MKLKLGKPLHADSVYSEANIITLIRLVASLFFFILAIVRNNPTYNYIGFFIHWLVDFLDGYYARKFKQETIVGAEIDIIADRFEILFFYVIFLHFRPYLALPAAIYLVNYAFIDFYLSYQFIKFNIISPNYFYKVDRNVYLLNYSPGGKFSNSSVVTLGLIFLPQLAGFITIYALGLIVVKTYSVFRLFKLQSLKHEVNR